MGKNLARSSSSISIQNNGPGCMWGVFHVMKYHHWRHIKKKLPYKRPLNGKNVVGTGNSEHEMEPPKSERICHHDSIGGNDSTVDDKMAQSTSVGKSSVRSRLKSLISDELSKMKCRHRRASSCPAHTTETHSDLNLEPSDDNPLAGEKLHDRCQTLLDDDKNFSFPKLLDPLNSSKDQNLEDYSINVDETGKIFRPNQALLAVNSGNENQNLEHIKELNKDASTCQLKEISDALDIINSNKEFFLKVFQDPSSPLAQHLHSQQALSSKRSFSKSLSFSSSSSFAVRGPVLRKLKTQKEITDSVTFDPQSKEYNRSLSMPSVPVEYQTAHPHPRKNQTVMKRFKNLKHKIKHVIRHSKNEKYRITLDGVLDKIPRGHELPKELKSDNHLYRDDDDSAINYCGSSHCVPSACKTASRNISPTSLRESLDKYCQLYESSCKGEAKHHSVEPLIIRTEDSPQRSASKSIRRMLSSPDLKSDLGYSEDSSVSLPSNQVGIAADATMSTKGDVSEQSDTENDIQQNLDSDTINADRQAMETVPNIEEVANLDSISDNLEANQGKPDTELSAETKSRDDITGPGSLSSADVADLVDEKPAVADDGTEKQEVPSEHIEFQKGAKDKAEFDYVKGILELSGFSRDEVLGTWHSDDQPMDPSLFDEVAGCMYIDPECSGYEDGYPGYNLLLFDLINEVLMEIYARSCTYCPMPLSTLCHIRPMPMGHRVLEEVWTNISWYLTTIPEPDQLLDYIVSRDLAKYDGWMNLQFDCECVGLEVEDIIFDDLLDELLTCD